MTTMATTAITTTTTTDQCKLLSGPLHYLLQVCLAAISLTALYLKNVWERNTGRSNRSFIQFLCDSFKQLLGAAWMHILNLIFATIFATWMTFKVNDECNWYWVEIMIDTTLGVFIEYWLLQTLISLKRYNRCFDYLAEQVIQVRSLKETTLDPEELVPKTPDSNEQPLLQEPVKSGPVVEAMKTIDICKYILQVFVWLFIVTCMKLTMLVTMIIFNPQLQKVATFVLQPVVPFRGTYFDLELLIVMIVTPAVMDAFQLIAQDNIFLDIDIGTVLECKDVPQVESKLRKGFRLSVTEATQEVEAWKKVNAYLQNQVRALRSELDYAKTGFVARILTMSFRGRMKDGKPGLYRLVRATKLYDDLEGAKESDKKLQQGQLLEVTEWPTGKKGSKERMARVEETVMNPEGWIRIVDTLGRHTARYVAPPADVAS